MESAYFLSYFMRLGPKTKFIVFHFPLPQGTFLKNTPSPKEQFYSSAQWKALRAKAKAKAINCAFCKMRLDHKTHGAIHVDHVIPRKQRPDLALTLSNLQCLCTTCHVSTKARLERGHAPAKAIGRDGWPV